jgi:hypothetical protein
MKAIKPIRKPVNSRERSHFRHANTKKDDQYGLFRPTSTDYQTEEGTWSTVYRFLGYIPQLVNGKAGLTNREHARNKVYSKELGDIPLPLSLRHKTPIELNKLCDDFMQATQLPDNMKAKRVVKKFIAFEKAYMQTFERPKWATKLEEELAQ